MKDFEKMAAMIEEAYIITYGAEKWQGLTDQQKRDTIMILAEDAARQIGMNF